MRKLRIAVGSNDVERVLPDHLRQAQAFYVYDLTEGGGYQLVARLAAEFERLHALV